MLLVTLGLVHGNARAEPIIFAVNDWCPYICDITSTKQGILPDIVTEIFKAQGITASFVKMPFTRGVESVRTGEVQGIVGVIPAVAPSLIFPDEPAIDTQFCFFTGPGSTWNFSGFDKAYSNISVGVAFGKAIDARFERAFGKVSRVSGSSDVTQRMIAMLRLQRLDALVEDKRSVQYVIARENLPSLRTAGCMETKFEYVAFSPANVRATEYAKMFSKGIVKLRESGRLAQIIAAYVNAR